MRVTVELPDHPWDGEEVEVHAENPDGSKICRLLRNHRGFSAGDVLFLPAEALGAGDTSSAPPSEG